MVCFDNHTEMSFYSLFSDTEVKGSRLLSLFIEQLLFVHDAVKIL